MIIRNILKSIPSILVMAQFATAAYCVNQRQLDSESDVFYNKICSGSPIKKERIKERLDFVSENDSDVDPKYLQATHFSTHYEQIMKEIQNGHFQKFAEMCKEVHGE